MLLIFFFSLSPTPLFAVNGTLSLRAAISEGIGASPTLQIQQRNVDAKKAEVTKAWSEFLPHAQLDVGRGRQSDDNYFTILQRRRLRESQIVGAETLDTSLEDTFAYLNFGTKIDLFKGFGNLHNLREKQAELDIAEHEFLIEKNNLIFNMTQLYIELLNLQTTLDFLKKAIASAVEQESNLERRMEVGLSPKSDSERAQERTLEFEWQQLKARQTHEVSQSKLNQLLGRNLDSPIQIGSLRLKNGLTPNTIDAYLKKIRHNLEFEKSQFEVAKDRYVRRKAYAQNLGMPNIKFEYNYEERGDKFDTVEGGWKLGVVMRIPIFDGMANFAEQKKARASYRSSRIKSKIALENAEIDIRNHHANWYVLDRYIKFLQKKRERQQGIYNQTKTALKEKAATLAQLNATEVLVLETETELLKNKRLQFLDSLRLELLTGEISDEEFFRSALAE